MGNPVGWFEIYVQDMKRAKAFYEGVFGFKLDKLPDAQPASSGSRRANVLAVRTKKRDARAATITTNPQHACHAAGA